MAADVFAELRSAAWCMEPRRLSAFFDGLTVLLERPAERQERSITPNPGNRSYQIDGRGRAVIPVRGMLLNGQADWLRAWGVDATDYSEIEAAVDEAVNDRGAAGILLQVDSPGGMVDGSAAAAVAIRNARTQKPVEARIDSLGASAAYRLASQAQRISAGPDAEVGSIGVYMGVADTSRAFEARGVKIHLLRSGSNKGVGMPGVPITNEQLAPMQAVVDGLAANLIDDVAVGRNRDRAEIAAVADGRTFLARDAMAKGLVDEVAHRGDSKSVLDMDETEDETSRKALAGTDASEAPAPEAEETPMADETTRTDEAPVEQAPTAATLSELRAAFPNEPEFVMDMAEASATMEQAQLAYATIRENKLSALEQANADLTEKLAAAEARLAAAGTAGAEPLKNSGQAAERPTARDFAAEARQAAKQNGTKYGDEMRKLVAADPEGWQAYKASIQPVQRKVR